MFYLFLACSWRPAGICDIVSLCVSMMMPGKLYGAAGGCVWSRLSIPISLVVWKTPQDYFSNFTLGDRSDLLMVSTISADEPRWPFQFTSFFLPSAMISRRFTLCGFSVIQFTNIVACWKGQGDRMRQRGSICKYVGESHPSSHRPFAPSCE